MMRQAGRYLPEYRALREKHAFLEVAKTPELAAEVSLQPFRRLGVDAVIVFSDILIPAEAMGAPIELGDAGPVIHSPIRTAAQVEALAEFDPERETRFVGDAIRQLCRELGPDVPVLGFAAAPWTLACYMIQGRSREGFPAAKTMLADRAAPVPSPAGKDRPRHGGLSASADRRGRRRRATLRHLGRRTHADEYREFELPATQLLIDELGSGRYAGDSLFQRHRVICWRSARRTGANVLSVDWRVDLARCASRFGRRIALQGNVDPCVLLGPEEGVRPRRARGRRSRPAASATS